MGDEVQNLRDRLTRQGEETLGKLAQELLESPLVAGAVGRAFEARERAVQAQEAAMAALNIPSAADVERLTRRLRSVAQRLEGIEDALDRVDQRLGSLNAGAPEDRLRAIEGRLDELVAELKRSRSGGSAPASEAKTAGGAGEASGTGARRRPARRTAAKS